MSETVSTTWGGWQAIDPRCYGCKHSAYYFGRLVCYCASRTMSCDGRYDKCLSYKLREVLRDE